VGERLVQRLQRERDARAERDREPDAVPHGSERLSLTSLDEERGDDADDQRGLEALSESDDERGKHV
jgi:hypothetical protein